LYKDTSDQLFILNNLGIVAKNKEEYLKSINYYETGLELAIPSGNLRREGELVYNMANVYFKLHDTISGMKYLERSSEITQMIGNDRDMAVEHQNLGLLYTSFGDLKKGEYHSLIAVKKAVSSSYWEAEYEARFVLADIYSKMGKYKRAFEHFKIAQFTKDSLDLDQVNSQAMAIEHLYNQEKQALADSLQQEKDDLEEAHQDRLSAEKVSSRERLLWVAAGVILLVIIAIIFLFRANQKVKHKNEIITKSNELITAQKDEIEVQHKEITDSINYAQRIQNALIEGNEEWDKISRDHYLLFKPKDVVSGDFYWAYHSDEEELSIWVTADCTGHGVPGAFMSMLGIGFLNEIVVENGNRNGSEILGLLRSKIVNALEQKSSDQQQKDGMDIALCIWNKKTNELAFTGANNPLWIIRKTENVDFEKFEKNISHPDNGHTLFELHANKMPVGFHSGEQGEFKSKHVGLMKGDVIVSFTDGYADQFGGDKGKKLKYKPFKELLLEIHSSPIKIQGEILDDKFENWKGSLEQVDDVCVIGVRV